jgi:DNA-binding CsgD family transcriptional regulator
LEFDGKNWTTYPIVNGTNVRSVLATKDGRFYASSFNEFGYFVKERNGQFLYHSLVNKTTLNPANSNELYNIVQGNNTIYFQSERCVYAYKGQSVERLPFDGKLNTSAFVHGILFVASEQKGVFMLNGKLFVRIPGSDVLDRKKISAILPYGNQVLLVTSLSGVYLFDGSSVVPYSTGIDEFLKTSQVFCATTNGKQLVFGTVQRGIAVLDIKDRSVLYVNTFTGLQNNTVLSVKFDNNQNLWLGLDNGIDYVMLNSPMLNLFGNNNLYGAGYASYLNNKTLYLGTNQGLYQTSYPTTNGSMPLQLKLIKGMEGQVWCLTEIDRTIFCGDDQGAFIIHPDKPERIQGLPGTWTFKALRRHPDLILGCSYQGLFVLKKTGTNWKLAHFVKGHFAESSPMFEEDSDGTIWFSHWQKGLFHLFFNASMDSIVKVDLYNGSNGLPSDRNNTCFRIQGKLVFSTMAGFYGFNRQTRKMEPLESWNKLFVSPPNSVRLHEAKNGDVWCVSGSFVGIARKTDDKYRMDSLSHRILQPKLIIGFEQFNFMDEHRTLLSTEDGFCWLDNRRQTIATNTFKVFIRKVQVTNKGFLETNGSRKHHKTDGDIYRHSQNSLRFEYVAPEYRNAGLVQYSFMLEDYDDGWSNFSQDNLKEYTHLPKGHYTFKVRAKNELESRIAECTYRFTIEPAWYETKIALFVYVLLILCASLGLLYLINHRYKKGARDMEVKKEKELQEQKKHFDAETTEKKNEIKELKNQQLQYELRHKSQELASSTMNLIRKNEILLEIIENLSQVGNEIKSSSDANTVLGRLQKMERSIRQNIENDDNWKRFEENFDLVYENFLKHLSELYPNLSVSDKKLCAYLKMDLSSKDIAALFNISVRSVEMSRYRLRQKMALDRDTNLVEFLQKV